MYKKKTELGGKKLPVGLLQNNIDEVAKRHNLPNNHIITKTLISQRIATGKHRVSYVQGNCFPDLLLNIEDKVCSLIIAM